MFGDIAKTFGRNFLVANLGPAMLFVATNLILVLTQHLILPNWQIWQLFQAQSLNYKAAILFVSSVFLAIGLQQFNIYLIRLYEGYYGRHRFPFRQMATSQRQRFNKLKAEIYRLKNEKRDAGLKEYLLSRNFADEQEILPTKLGNVIRAFEWYPHKIYNIDPITGWSRLVGVIPQPYQEQLEKNQVDFTFALNISFLSALVGMESCVQFVSELSSAVRLEPFLTAVVSFCLSYGVYRWSCSLAAAWGEYIRAAFDLYRYDLLRQMRVFLPGQLVTPQEEKGIWSRVQEYTFYVTDPGSAVFPRDLQFMPTAPDPKETKS